MTEPVELRLPPDIKIENPIDITRDLLEELVDVCENFSRYLYSMNALDGRTMRMVRFAINGSKIKLNDGFKDREELASTFYYIMALMDSYLTGLGYRYYPNPDTCTLNYFLSEEEEEH